MNLEYVILFVLGVVASFAALSFALRHRNEFIIQEGSAGLLYHEGKLVDVLSAGRHIRWGRNYFVGRLETRKSLLTVPGQEVLSADNVALKVSVVVTSQVVDPETHIRAADNATMHIYNAVQTAVRSVVAGVTMEDLLSQRVAIGDRLRELASPQAQSVGVVIHAVEVRDVMLPGELRKAFSEVLKARQEGQAALERARGESAAMRNLSNAARLLEEQPALATLRFLQTLENSKSTQSVLMNDLSAFAPILKFRAKQENPDQT